MNSWQSKGTTLYYPHEIASLMKGLINHHCPLTNRPKKGRYVVPLMDEILVCRSWRFKKKHHNSLRVHTNTVRHRAAIGCARCHLLSVRKFQQGMVIKCLHFLVNYSIQFCYLKKWWLMWEKGCSKKKLLIVIDPITAEPTNKSPPTSGTPTLPSSKLRWQWTVPIFNRNYVFKLFVFHCYVSSKVCIASLWVKSGVPIL